MTYPYGTRGAPVVGSGLGGLPRRIMPTPPAPPAPVVQATPYSEWAAPISSQFYSYDRFIASSFQHSDGNFSDNMVFHMSNGDRFLTPIIDGTSYRTYQKRHSRGIITSIPIFSPNGSNYAVTGVDNNCYVAVTSSSLTSQNLAGSLFLRNQDGTVYYFVDCINRRVDRFTKSGPTVTTLTWTHARTFGGLNTLITAAMNPNGEVVIFGVNSANTNELVVIRLNPESLAVENTRGWTADVGFNNLFETQRDTAVFAGTTVAIRWLPNGTTTFRYFVYDVGTLLGRFTNYNAPGDQSPQTTLMRNENHVFMLIGAGSGGSYGQTSLRTLTAAQDNTFGSVSTGSSTSGGSFVNSFFCNRPDIISTIFYNPYTFARTMNFRPGDNTSFSWSGFNFSFSGANFSNYTPTIGSSVSITSTTPSSFDSGYSTVRHYRRDLVVF